MRNIIQFLLNMAPLLAPIPTGWAVYAGLSMREAWPMPFFIAAPGAVALIAVSISISSYIVDVNSFNKSCKSKVVMSYSG